MTDLTWALILGIGPAIMVLSFASFFKLWDSEWRIPVLTYIVLILIMSLSVIFTA